MKLLQAQPKVQFCFRLEN